MPASVTAASKRPKIVANTTLRDGKGEILTTVPAINLYEPTHTINYLDW